METLKKAQQFIEFSSLSLTGKEDFVPFIIVIDDSGREFFVGFATMPTEPEAKDQLADIIMALCVIHGAVEVTFGSAAWSATDNSDLPPSKNPDRKEIAVVSAATSEGVNTVCVASVVRENNKVGIGLWEQLNADVAAGRFAEALHMGLKLSGKIPSEVRDFLSEQIESGLADEILRSTVGVISEARRAAMSIEKREWKK
jgi:hypothetical protein